MRHPSDARLLFVVSDDYGELSNALYFVRGQEFIARTTLLLPRRVYAVNQGSLPVRALEYATVQDIISAVEAVDPDVVFLFSGYLYTINSLFSIESFEVLMRVLQGRGCRIVTSDPFLRGLSTPDLAAELGAIHEPFLRASELLQDVVHYYPTPCAHLPTRTTQVSVFNPSFMRASEGGLHNHTRRFLAECNGDSTLPLWLFVLSSEDYRVQVAKRGAEQFAGHVIGMLTAALAAGRQAVFIAPPPCIDSVNARLPATRGLVLHSFCPHEVFTSLALDAEYGFYWNMFSNSIVVRLANGLPTFFFDIGHLGRLYRLAVENYFLGWRPVCLDPRQELTVPLLMLLGTLCRRNLEAIRAHYQSAPSPQQTVEALLGEFGEPRRMEATAERPS